MPSFARCTLAAAALVLLAVVLPCHAQVTIDVTNIHLATKPSPGSGHDYIKMLNETVNPANGSVSLRIAAPVPRQRGDVNYPYYVFGYDSSGVSQPKGDLSYACVDGACVPVVVTSWTDDARLGGDAGRPGLIPGGFVANSSLGQLFYSSVQLYTQFTNYPLVYATCYFNTGYVFVDPQGSRHSLNLQWITQNGSSGPDGGCTAFNINPRQLGGDTNYQAQMTGTPNSWDFNTYWTDAHGRGRGVEDTNGNCCGPNGSPTFVNNKVTAVTVPGLANPYTFTYGTATRSYQPDSVVVYTPPGSGCNLLPPENSQKPVLTAITLPNSTPSNPQQYHLQYDPTLALLTKVTYPTGAWVSYTWATQPQAESLGLGPDSVHCEYRHGWPYLQTRTVSFDGVNSALQQTFQYQTFWGTGNLVNQWTQKTTTVTTQDLLRPGHPSFQTVYTYSGFPLLDGFTNAYLGQTPVENSIVYKDWNGAVLQTVTKNWQNTVPPRLLSECTTLPTGGISGVFYTYGPLGVITDKQEYDYSANLPSNACAQGATAPTQAPTRDTVTTYHSFPPTPFYPIPSMYDRPDNVKVFAYVNGTRTLVAETDYTYDSYGTAGITQVTANGHDDTTFPPSYTNRGNPTSVTKLCLQSAPACSSGNPTSSFTYDETGQILSATDPRGNTTQYFFNDSFVSGDTYTSTVTPTGNTNTYLTKIIYPSTNGVSHIEQFSYDYPSGQLTVSTDQNQKSTTYRYDDFFARLTQTTSPDNGGTTIAYNDSGPSPSVTTTKKINSSQSLTAVSIVDGFGHIVQSKLTSDPQGTDFTDSTYDGLGSVWKQSNPYRSTSDSTYGITTSAYDGLGRPVQMTSPDGSTLTTTYSGNSTVVIDQAGKGRRSLSDALGRLIEVDEPGPNSTSTPGTGSVTITGSEQSVVTGDPCAPCAPMGCPSCPTYSYDYGTVSVTVNGFTITANYANGSTASSVASSLAAAINGNSSSPVTAVANGATVNLTAEATGLATNYSLSASSATANTQYFSTPSFHLSTSASTLTGGSNVGFGSGSLVALYAYDALNNLACAVQKGTDTSAFTTCGAAPATWRPRSFTYDSLSRLLSATNPESGAISYVYDANGNLSTKTSPRPNQTGTATVVATYIYDALNRLTQKSFDDGLTPTVKYGYDGIAPTGCSPTPPALTDGYPVDQRTAMCDAAGAESWSHDMMGRVLTDSRTTNGYTKSTVYAYLPYVDGSLNTLTYPSARTVTYTTSAAERLLSAVDSTGPINYALNATYAPQGALASLQNGGSLYSRFLYNNRLQPCWMFSTNTSAGAPTSCTQTGVANGTILDYQYNFSLGAGDNGNVTQITNRRDPTRTQNFTYDSLNRLATAQTQTSGVTIPNSNCWGLTFGYDAWGNLLSWSATGPAGCSQPLPLNLTLNSNATNRILNNTIAGQVSNYCYDAPGNLIHITSSGANCPTSGPYQYAYDAENHLTSTAGVNYAYDGDGKRVQKSNGKLYWYGAGSDPLDETDLAANINNASFKEYVFFGGKRIARRDSSNNVSYYFADHLGTARVVTNAGGTPLDDSDFYPFGVERSVLGPSSGNNYKFTGKERDSETGLDYFGARYYGSNMGRFMTPDPLPWIHWQRGNEDAQRQFEAYIANPQNFNMYAYVRNNPLNHTDPTGMNACGTKDDSSCKVTITISDRSKDAKGNYNDQYTNVANQGNYNATAVVNVNGKDVGTFLIKTTPSDSNKSGTLSAGVYSGTLTEHSGHLAIRIQPTTNLPTTGPNPQQHGAWMAQGDLIHRAGVGNFTGVGRDGRAVSEGCLVVCTSQFSSFEDATGMSASPPQRHFTIDVDTSVNQKYADPVFGPPQG